MHKKITFSDLLRYSYEEIKNKKKIEYIRSQIETNQKLKQELIDIEKIKNNLNKISEYPSLSLINKILDYSKVIRSVKSSKERFCYILN
ncbi:MAG TPA: hypothetical protein P5250_03695 [Bacteroidales bacterium]|nr:hypothetical protein [Bacteroidales bacterium]